ncbi:MAG: hypothetical protein JNL74_23825 [Fibrobacteres bacterium]|nr:hypothetical protein [Fibrobacterota bacterium]
MDVAEITELKILPKNQGKLVALFIATINNDIDVKGSIVEGKQGIRIKAMGFCFTSKEAKTRLSNRVLATYVINHCVEDNSAE